MRRARGFTLVELLTAIAIFAVISTMLFRMVKGALDVWRIGEQGRESIEKGGALIEEIAQDFRMLRADAAPGMPEAPVRLIATFGSLDLDVDQIDESLLQRVAFARSCPEERTDPALRQSGTVPGGKEFLSDVESGTRPARACGGLAEVAYATLSVPKPKSDPSLLTLYRWFRTPIGGDGSLLDPAAFERPERAVATGVALAENVLYLGVEFWGRDTEGFDAPVDSERGPLSAWDSTRALLGDAKGPNRFRFAKGEGSLGQTDDDVFPRRVKVTLVLARDEDEQALLRLAVDLPASGDVVRVDSARAFEALGTRKFLKVGGEWMTWTSINGTELRVQRGARGTPRVSHSAGARIHLGSTYERVIEIPVFREDWNEP